MPVGQVMGFQVSRMATGISAILSTAASIARSCGVALGGSRLLLTSATHFDVDVSAVRGLRPFHNQIGGWAAQGDVLHAGLVHCRKNARARD